MTIKKMLYGQKAVETPMEKGSFSEGRTSFRRKRTAVILRYYRTVSSKNGSTCYGICIDAVSGKGKETYFAQDICSAAGDAENLIRQLYHYAVLPSCAEECIDEILSSEILSTGILSSVKHCAQACGNCERGFPVRCRHTSAVFRTQIDIFMCREDRARLIFSYCRLFTFYRMHQFSFYFW